VRPSGPRRLRWPAALAGLAVLLLLLNQLAAWNPRHYIHLMPSGRPSAVVGTLTVAAALITTAVVLVLRGTVLRRVAGIAGGVAALLVGVCGGLGVTVASTVNGINRQDSPRVVATSPDNAFELVVVEHIVDSSTRTGHTWTTTFDAASLRPADHVESGCADEDPNSF
jgi:hypothetical protein